MMAALFGLVGLTAVRLVVLRIKTIKESMPFGPFLAIATMITLIWGPNILAWIGRLLP